MPQRTFSPDTLEELGKAYGVEHEKTYGYQADDPFQLVSVRVIARGLSKESRVPERMQIVGPPEASAAPDRDVYFAQRGEWLKTPVIGRSEVDGRSSGPLVVEEYDSTTIVPPGWTASLDSMNNIVLDSAD
jgi:N-methylhydantoinase A